MNSSSSRSGLDIARQFWLEWGRPWLASHYPDLFGRIGVGLFSGSDVLGADDELSCDHGWGPRFDVFLVDEDSPANQVLESELRTAMPKEWGGFQSKFKFTPAIQVHTVQEFFGNPFPNRRLPRSPIDWACCEYKLVNLESHLHFFRHGAVFHDPAGLLSDVQAELYTYPDDIWLLRMAQLCFEIAHYGQYNFCWRLVHRNDPVVAEIALGNFQCAVMALALVMDRDYAPYWKWLHHVFRSREIAIRLDALLNAISTTLEYETRAASVNAICTVLMDELVKRGILPHDLDDGSGLPTFFQARAYLIEYIFEPSIKALIR